jgi:hypothetical protein
MGFNLWRWTYAKIWDNNGEFIKNKRFNRNKKSFQLDDKTFNIKTKEGSFYDDNKLFYNRRFYQYNIDCPDPLKINSKVEPLINSTDYNTLLETRHLQKLNDVNKKGLFGNLDFKTILAIGAIIVVGYLLLTGNLV